MSRHSDGAPRIADRWFRLGTLGAILLVVGSGWYQVFTVPPYYFADEQAHVGYVLELEAGRLPTVDTPIDVARGGPDLRQQVDRSPAPRRDVWVANNPPLAYILAIPATVVVQLLDLPGGPLIGLRLTNLVAFGVAVGYVARLARRLAGGNATVGLVAASAFAAVPYVAAAAGAGFIDGVALLCTVALVDALVTVTRSGPTLRQVLMMSGWCAAAALVRPMTAAVGAVAVLIGSGVIAVRSWRGRRAGHRRPAEVSVGPLRAALVSTAPAVLTSGWFYLRSQRLYGDPTASRVLFEKFGRTAPSDLPWSALRVGVWAEPVRTLLNRRLPEDVPSSPMWLWDVTRWSVIGLVGAGVGLALVEVVRARRAGRRADVPAVGLASTALLGAVAVGLVAEHWAGGGNIHPRYLLFPLALVVIAISFTVVAVGRKVAGVGLVLALSGLQAVQVPRQNASLPRAGWAMLPSTSSLTEPIGPAALRYLGIAVMVVAFAVVALAVRRTPPHPWRKRRGPDDLIGAGPLVAPGPDRGGTSAHGRTGG